MCGIFGFLASKDADVSPAAVRGILDHLFILSSSRGKEASGVALLNGRAIHVLKDSVPPSIMIRSVEYRALFRHLSSGSAAAVMGHSRLVTNGLPDVPQNNQPVVTEGLAGVHNGIIVNDEDIWSTLPLKRRFQVDTEVLLTLIRYYHSEGSSICDAVRRAYQCIEGTASIAVLFEDLNHVLLATNNGSLYGCFNKERSAFVFASERGILDRLIKKHSGRGFQLENVGHVKAGEAVWINLDTLAERGFLLHSEEEGPMDAERKRRDIVGRYLKETGVASLAPQVNTTADTAVFDTLWKAHAVEINRLKRCGRCILPETMPFIDFDQDGVCNYCRRYTPLAVRPLDELKAWLALFRRKDGMPDSIVTFSGGRDSCYGLHVMKKELGMNPVAYTYDWGMITDLGRRNQARLCGKLGVEHILISADIKRKRNNIRMNVSAWLKRPALGTIPLFMAGDKQYFYYANKLRREMRIDPVILCENMLETTRFKSGYCGIAPRFDSAHTYSLTVADKLRMGMHYAGECIRNPAYINRSLLDTAGAFFSYYIMDHDFMNLFSYMRWDEVEIEKTLLEEYNWEIAPDTSSTWRIGDGTAAFYNYIYYWAAGFTENDTFRSNQIREGMITRGRALELVARENQPRYDSIRWYCDMIGLDWRAALYSIHRMPARRASGAGQDA